jgi:hypothetical protein
MPQRAGPACQANEALTDARAACHRGSDPAVAADDAPEKARMSPIRSLEAKGRRVADPLGFVDE